MAGVPLDSARDDVLEKPIATEKRRRNRERAELGPSNGRNRDPDRRLLQKRARLKVRPFAREGAKEARRSQRNARRHAGETAR